VDEEKPTLLVRLMPTGKLKIKLPRKGAKWHGAFAGIDEAVKAAQAEGLEPPFFMDYVDEESE